MMGAWVNSLQTGSISPEDFLWQASYFSSRSFKGSPEYMRLSASWEAVGEGSLSSSSRDPECGRLYELLLSARQIYCSSAIIPLTSTPLLRPLYTKLAN